MPLAGIDSPGHAVDRATSPSGYAPALSGTVRNLAWNMQASGAIGLNPDPSLAVEGLRSGWRALRLVALLALFPLMTGCASPDRGRPVATGGESPNGLSYADHSYWAGDFVSGAPSIVINLRDQHAYFYKGKKLVGVSEVSTGKEGTNTPIGRFAVKEKDIDHASSLFGDYVGSNGVVVKANIAVRQDPQPPGTHYVGAPMPYFMRIVGGVGMHQGYLPGVPASHGCIRLPARMAAKFYQNSEVGTPVEIKP